MSSVYGNQNEVRERVRRRRRRIAATRRECVNGRARSVLIVLSVCLMAALAGYIGMQGSGSADNGLAYGAYAAEETIYKNVTVHSGDTIWGLAGVYSDSSKDIRALVKEICALNNVVPGKIYPGQILIIPVPAHMS